MSDDFTMKLIAKLDRKNYQTWKFQLTSLLVANSVFEIVIGAETMPGEAEPGRKQWIKDNAKAMMLISTSTEEAQLQCLLV